MTVSNNWLPLLPKRWDRSSVSPKQKSSHTLQHFPSAQDSQAIELKEPHRWEKKFAQRLAVKLSMLPSKDDLALWMQRYQPECRFHSPSLYQTLLVGMKKLEDKCNPHLLASSCKTKNDKSVALLEGYLNAHFPRAYLLGKLLPDIVEHHRQNHLAIRKGSSPPIVQAMHNISHRYNAPDPRCSLFQMLFTSQLIGSIGLTSFAFGPSFFQAGSIISITVTLLSFLGSYGAKCAEFFIEWVEQVQQEHRRIALEDKRYAVLTSHLHLSYLFEHDPIDKRLIPSLPSWPQNRFKPIGTMHTCANEHTLRFPRLGAWASKVTNSLLTKQEQTMLYLQEHLEQHVIGQQAAVKQIAATIQRNHFNLFNTSKHLGAFLISGPPGVGKTTTAKALAALLYGSQKSMIALDMRSYSDPGAIQRLMGMAPTYFFGYGEPGHLTNLLGAYPRIVILFKNIDAAHPSVWSILRKMILEGYVSDRYGKQICLRQCVIMLTARAVDMSNRCSSIDPGASTWMQLATESELQQYLEHLPYTALPPPEIAIILNQLLQFYNQQLAVKSIRLTLTARCHQHIVTTACNSIHGARELSRFFDVAIGHLLTQQFSPLNGTISVDSQADGTLRCAQVVTE